MSPVNKAIQQALEALDRTETARGSPQWERENEAMDALRAALEAQPVPSACNGACYADGDKCNCGQGAQKTEPTEGNWVNANDVLRHVKALDEALNGPGGASRPLLIDVLSQVEQVRREIGRPLLHALTPQPPAQQTEGPLFMGACITEGRLHATVMRREKSGSVTVVATAEMDAAKLHTHDGIASMNSQPPAQGDARALLEEVDACLVYIRRRLHGLTPSYDGIFRTLSDASTAVEQLRRIGAAQPEPAPPASELIAVQLLAAAERLAARGWFEPSHCANAETLQDMAAMRAAIQAARDAGI